jgi:hypothetical protein
METHGNGPITLNFTDGQCVQVNREFWTKNDLGRFDIVREETKKLMSESKKGIGKGDKNSQYGTCWITRDGENKKIKKQELDSFTQKGWEKGRRLKN